MKILVWIFAPLSLVEPVYLIYKIVTVSLDIRVRKYTSGPSCSKAD